jgi:hypothetical protein
MKLIVLTACLVIIIAPCVAAQASSSSGKAATAPPRAPVPLVPKAAPKVVPGGVLKSVPADSGAVAGGLRTAAPDSTARPGTPVNATRAPSVKTTTVPVRIPPRARDTTGARRRVGASPSPVWIDGRPSWGSG